MRRLRAISLVCVSVLPAACGWHLQGTARLPPSFATTYIDTDDTYTDFYKELRRSLVDSGVKLSDRAADARAIVKVQHDTSGQRIAAVSARNTPQEFQVFYIVDYSVAINGAVVGSVEHLELTTNYSYDSTVVLAKQHEQYTIQLALARELASIVLRRLATVQVATP